MKILVYRFHPEGLLQTHTQKGISSLASCKMSILSRELEVNSTGALGLDGHAGK